MRYASNKLKNLFTFAFRCCGLSLKNQFNLQPLNPIFFKSAAMIVFILNIPLLRFNINDD